MTTNTQIHEVYIDDTTRPEKHSEAKELVSEVLGSLAIEQVASASEAGAMIIIGGDGGFLHSLRRHNYPDIPVAGVNTGTLGFYMDTLPDEGSIYRMVRRLSTGQYITKLLPILEVPVPDDRSHYAVNEAVVARQTLQAFNASLKIGEGEFEHFVGDGLIFSTPQGSTSYSLSARGPILHEDIDAYVVTPSNPHISQRYYSLIAPAIVPSRLETVVSVKDRETRPFIVSVDDQILDWPENCNDITIRVADKKLKMARFVGHDYFDHVSAAFRGKQA